jgi:hypothetical protein
LKRSAVLTALVALGLVVPPGAAASAHTTSTTLDPGETIRVRGKNVHVTNMKIRIAGPKGGSTPIASYTAPKRGSTRIRTTFFYESAIKMDLRVGPHRAYARWREGTSAGARYRPRVIVHWADR